MKNYVVAYGRDCDGANNGDITRYISEEVARERAKHSNEWSDGIQYTCVDEEEAARYIEAYGKNTAPSLLPVFNGEGDIVEQILTWEEFEAKYSPQQNHITAREEFNGWLYETYGPDEEYVRKLAQHPTMSDYVWTIIEGDQNQMCIVSGWHFVNRFGYVITGFPCPKGCSITVEDEEDKVIDADFEDEKEG